MSNKLNEVYLKYLFINLIILIFEYIKKKQFSKGKANRKLKLKQKN